MKRLPPHPHMSWPADRRAHARRQRAGVPSHSPGSLRMQWLISWPAHAPSKSWGQGPKSQAWGLGQQRQKDLRHRREIWDLGLTESNSDVGCGSPRLKLETQALRPANIPALLDVKASATHKTLLSSVFRLSFPFCFYFERSPLGRPGVPKLFQNSLQAISN